MPISRRNALIGLGALVGGAGIVGGTGAFTSVQAERTVDVQTTGDSTAGLGFIPADDPSLTNSVSDDVGATIPNSGPEDGELQISTDSLNQDAVTEFNPSFAVSNNSADGTVYFYVQGTSDIGPDEALDFVAFGTDGSGSLNYGYSLVSDASSPRALEIPTGEIGWVGVVINLIDYNETNLSNLTVTFVADEDAPTGVTTLDATQYSP